VSDVKSFSSSHTCSCGVPQGSLLGPLLFVFYTTPLSTLISSLSLNHQLYADDTQVFSFCPSDLESSITHLGSANAMTKKQILHTIQIYNTDSCGLLRTKVAKSVRSLGPKCPRTEVINDRIGCPVRSPDRSDRGPK